jgi:hypothetical protein
MEREEQSQQEQSMYKVFSGSINKYKRLKETSVAKAEKGQIL